MSITQGPSFRANESIAAYVVVALNGSTTSDNLLCELADTSTSAPLGIIQDAVSTNGSADIAQAGQARALCGASVTAGDTLTWQTATGKVISLTDHTATAVGIAVGRALHSGSTNAVIKVHVQLR